MQRRGNATDPRDKEASLAELQRRVPPQNIEAERAVLGSIMLFSELLHSILGVLKAKDFYLERHQWIFEAILEQESENLPLDIISVANRLKINGHLEKLGGIAYLGELVDMIPSAAHIEHYAKIIRDKSILRQIITVCTDIASEAYEELEQVDLFLDSAEKRFFEIRQEGQNKDIAPISEIVKDAFNTIEKLYGRKELVTGVPTGFEEFDKLTSGLQPTDLIILAGRPAMGKTSLAMNMVANAAIHHNVPVVVFSLEMSKEQLVMRMLCSEGRVDASRLRTGNMKDTDIPRLMQAATELARSKIFIDDGANSSLLEMRSKCRRLKMEHGLGMIMIDYLQLMKGGDQGGDSREREISDISRGLKALAKELHVPVIALSQLNRSLERRPDKRPMPSDLRECVAGDTRVALADGRQVPIRDLVGQSPLVLAISKEGKVVEAQSDVVWCVGKRPLFEIELASGRTIQATAEHRFLSAKGWVCTHQLHPEDRIGIARQLPSPPMPKPWSHARLAFLGLMMGDGSYLKGQPMRFSSSSEENSCVVTQAAAQEFGATVTRYHGAETWHQLLISGNGNRWKPAGVNKWLRELGVFNQRSHEKRVPSEIFQCSNEDIAIFLRHYWAADGTLYTRPDGKKGSHAIQCCTTSLGLAKDIAVLLLRFGIVARIKKAQKKGYRANYLVYVSGSTEQKKFMCEIGSFGPRKAQAERLSQALNGVRPNPNVDTLPQDSWDVVLEAMEKANITPMQMATKRGLGKNSRAKVSINPTRRILKEYAEILDNQEIRSAAQSDIFWDKVVRILPLPEEQDVFDLSVPSASSWIGNDIFLHNSGALEQDADMIVFVYRDEVYNPETEDRGIAEIIIGKQRNGPTGTARVRFFHEYTKFDNLYPDQP